jgi:hypothetical protein
VATSSFSKWIGPSDCFEWTSLILYQVIGACQTLTEDNVVQFDVSYDDYVSLSVNSVVVPTSGTSPWTRFQRFTVKVSNTTNNVIIANLTNTGSYGGFNLYFVSNCVCPATAAPTAYPTIPSTPVPFLLSISNLSVEFSTLF